MDPLTIALAIYGGYQGYKSSKKAGASGLGRILGTAIGAYGGYNLGTGIGSLMSAAPTAATSAAALEGGTQAGLSALTNQAGISALQDVGTQTLTDAATQAALEGGTQAGIGAFSPYAGMPTGVEGGLGFQQLQTLPTTPSVLDSTDFRLGITQGGAFSPYASAAATPTSETIGVGAGTKDGGSFLEKATDYGKKGYSYLFESPVKGGKPGEMGLDVGKAALIGLPALSYLSGAFEREPYERSMFTYNVNYPDLYRSRKFYTQDPKTGEVKELEQQEYIPEERADVQSGDKFGPYKRETITLQQGGLATLNHFKDGGVNYLPSKTIHDEDDEDNYIRTNGYVEDGAGNGDKEEDTMLAQLADGEFVTRTDGVLGAGILAGANPKNAKEMRKLGAEFFYEQQKRFKRIYDLLDASRKATAH
jgi:hypothetical protein